MEIHKKNYHAQVECFEITVIRVLKTFRDKQQSLYVILVKSIIFRIIEI